MVKYIFDHPDDIAFLTIRELAAKVDVNPSTVVRACKELGFDGYTALKNQNKEAYRKKIPASYDVMLNKLRSSSPIEKRVESSFGADIDVLNATALQIPSHTIIEVVEKIASSNQTYIIGLEAARSIALYLAAELRTYLPNVREVVYYNGYLFDYLRHFRSGDVVLSVSFGKCIRQTVLAAKTAYEKDIMSISITDSKLSPLYKYSHISLLSASSSNSPLSSFIGALSISNAILACCAELKRESSIEQLKKIKEQWEEENIYYSE